MFAPGTFLSRMVCRVIKKTSYGAHSDLWYSSPVTVFLADKLSLGSGWTTNIYSKLELDMHVPHQSTAASKPPIFFRGLAPRHFVVCTTKVYFNSQGRPSVICDSSYRQAAPKHPYGRANVLYGNSCFLQDHILHGNEALTLTRDDLIRHCSLLNEERNENHMHLSFKQL